MARKKRYVVPQDEPGLDISSLVDVAFLLLIYFLVTSTLQPKEGDLGLALPSETPSESQMKLDPLTIKLEADGRIFAAQQLVEEDPNVRDLVNLKTQLADYKRTCEATDSKPIVVVAADDKALHQRFTDIVNVLYAVEIKNVTLTGYSG